MVRKLTVTPPRARSDQLPPASTTGPCMPSCAERRAQPLGAWDGYLAISVPSAPPSKGAVKLIKHVLMWDWREVESPERQAEKIAIIRDALASQIGKIPGVLAVDVVAPNTVMGDVNRELFAEMTFSDMDAVLGYHKSDVHSGVKDIVDPLVRGISIVDYEVA